MGGVHEIDNDNAPTKSIIAYFNLHYGTLIIRNQFNTNKYVLFSKHEIIKYITGFLKYVFKLRCIYLYNYYTQYTMCS